MSLWLEPELAPPCIRVLTRADTPDTHTYTHSLSGPSLEEGPPVVFALVWWGTVDVNTVNSLRSDSSAWRGWVQEADPPKTPRGDLPLYLTVTEGEPRSGDGGHLGPQDAGCFRGTHTPCPCLESVLTASDQTSPEIK